MENRSEQMCNRCSKFDFESIFDPSIKTPPATGRPIKPRLDVVTAAMEASVCPLCRLFAAVRFPREPPASAPSGHYHLRALSSLKLYALNQTKSRTASKPSVVLTVEAGNPVKKDPSGGYLMSYGLIALVSAFPSPTIQPFYFYGSLVDPRSINFHAVREWLRYCKTQHADLCEPRASLQFASTRVINCDTMDIVQMATLAPDLEYFALSYVWGAPNQETSIENSSSFRTSLSYSQLPQVVMDAIEVVKSLREQGCRYLWIDKYCIDQNDPRDKHRQIRSMDSVYEGAFATIVAASGNSANSGLPGVGLVSRKTQPAAIVNGIQIVSTLPHISTALKGTIWATRGWTYQEAVLSRRCIIFTDLQVYYVCRMSTCCEAITKAPDLTAPGDELPKTLFYPRVRTGPENISPLQLFSVQVEHYTQRVLSNESDALDAFKGILARAPFHSYWGIPILNISGNESLDAGFARCLDWRALVPDFSLHRRHKFPSWSWVGWSGQIKFYFNDSVGFSHFDITVWIELPDQRIVSLRSLHDAAKEMKVIAEVSPILHIKAYMVKVWFQRPSYPQRGNWTSAMFCWTHPDSECGRDKKRECGNRSVQIYLGDSPDQKVFSQHWDGLLLPSGSDRVDVPVLIIDWHDTIAQRIGVLHAKLSVINSLPKTPQTIRIE